MCVCILWPKDQLVDLVLKLVVKIFGMSWESALLNKCFSLQSNIESVSLSVTDYDK